MEGKRTDWRIRLDWKSSIFSSRLSLLNNLQPKLFLDCCPHSLRSITKFSSVSRGLKAVTLRNPDLKWHISTHLRYEVGPLIHITTSVQSQARHFYKCEFMPFSICMPQDSKQAEREKSDRLIKPEKQVSGKNNTTPHRLNLRRLISHAASHLLLT